MTTATSTFGEPPADGAKTRTLGRILGLVRPSLGLLTIGFLLLLVNAACRLTLPWLVAIAIDRHLLSNQMDGFVPLALAFLGVALLEMLSRRTQVLAVERAGQNSLYLLRVRVFAHLQRLPAAFFDRTPIGRLVGRVTTDVEALQEMFSSGLVTILGDLLFLLAALWILIALSPSLTLVTMLMVPFLVLVTMLVRTRVRRAYGRMRTRLSEMNGHLHEYVSGMPIVQLFGIEVATHDDFGAINDGVRDAQLRSVFWESILSASMEMLGSFTTALIVYYGGSLALGSTGGLTLGLLFAFVDYMRRFFAPLNDLTMKYTVLQNALVAGERVFRLLDVAAEPADAQGAQPASKTGSLAFRHVTFGYDPERPVLSDISFAVAPGECIAIVGATGAGKTTLLNLLTRLYDVNGGSIEVGGVDVRQLQRASLRRTIGVVRQDVFLFRGTILDNIRLAAPGIDEHTARQAADALGLGDVVDRFPAGYDAPVAERGKNLSAGEKQLIAFARMLVTSPPILALDEATSSVDTHTEELLQAAVRKVMAGRTSLVIAHRLSTIRDADRILLLDKGQLVEEGSHDELLAQDGAYARLYALQFEPASPPGAAKKRSATGP